MDSSAYAPPITRENPVWMFNDQLCRSIWLSYVKEVGYYWMRGASLCSTSEVLDTSSNSDWLVTSATQVDIDGVTVYQFSPTKDVFAMTNPNNFCYCPQVRAKVGPCCARWKDAPSR